MQGTISQCDYNSSTWNYLPLLKDCSGFIMETLTTFENEL